MSFLGFLLLGLIAGAIAKLILPGKQGGGWFITLLLGVVGALLGGWLGSLILNRPLTEFWDLGTWLLAIGGSIIVLLIYGLIAGRGQRSIREGRVFSCRGRSALGTARLALQELALAVVARQRRGGRELAARLALPAESAQQLAPRGREQVVAAQRAGPGQVVEQPQGGGGPGGHGHGGRAIQLHHRGRSEPAQRLVEDDDAVPVGLLHGRRDGMAFGDGGLQTVGAASAAEPVRPRQGCSPPRDAAAVPPPTVLIGEQHRVAVPVGPRREACGGELQEREQTVHLRYPRLQRGEHPRQPDGLVAQLRPHPLRTAAGRVRFVEDEIEHPKDRAEPRRMLLPRRQLERRARGRQRLLRAHDPLLHGRRGDEEGAGDLLTRQTAHDPQRQRDLRLPGEHRVARDEEKAQHVVVHGIRVPRQLVPLRLLLFQVVRDQRQTVVQPLAAAPSVHRLPLRHGRQPRGGVLRHALGGPLPQRGDQGLLREILGQAEVADHPRQCADDARGLDAPHGRDRPLGRLLRGGGRARHGVG
ncbi:unnamed protein product [Penicillium discolor]